VVLSDPNPLVLSDPPTPSACEVVSTSDEVLIQHVPSEDERSDITTKGLALQEWSRALMLLNMKFIT